VPISVVATFGDKQYVLASDKQPNEAILHSPGEREWKLERAYPANDEMGRRAIGFLLDSRGGMLFGKLTRYAVALGTVALVATLMYKFGPNRPQRWRDVWPGACIAAFLWLMCTLAFGWYVGNIADYNVLYGSIGAVIALIIWMYLLVVSSLVGCAFNAESEQLEAAANSLSE